MGFSNLGKYDIARRHDGKESEAVSCCDHALAGADESRAFAIAASGSGRSPHRDAEERLGEDLISVYSREAGIQNSNQTFELALCHRLRGNERARCYYRPASFSASSRTLASTSEAVGTVFGTTPALTNSSCIQSMRSIGIASDGSICFSRSAWS